MTTLILNLQEILATSVIAPGIVHIDLNDQLAKQHQIAILWSTEDVQEMRPDLTIEQAWEVLTMVKHRHDATMGINWDTLTCCADDIFPDSSNLTSGE